MVVTPIGWRADRLSTIHPKYQYGLSADRCAGRWAGTVLSVDVERMESPLNCHDPRHQSYQTDERGRSISPARDQKIIFPNLAQFRRNTVIAFTFILLGLGTLERIVLSRKDGARCSAARGSRLCFRSKLSDSDSTDGGRS